MLKKSITVDDALEVLNRACKADPKAMTALREARVRCNEELAKDPTIQVGKRRTSDDYDVGFLGVLNGLFGIDDRTGFGAIAMNYDVDCPGDCVVSGEKSVGQKCGCGETLVLGKLLGFSKVDLEKIPDRPSE